MNGWIILALVVAVCLGLAAWFFWGMSMRG